MIQPIRILITSLVSSFYTLIIIDGQQTPTLLHTRMDMRHVWRLSRSLYINGGLQHLLSIILYFLRQPQLITYLNLYYMLMFTGADPGFQVGGGGGGHLKKIAPSGGKRENCWGIQCEKSRFYAKKSYFFQNFRGGINTKTKEVIPNIITNQGPSLDIQLPVQSVPITTNVGSSNFVLCEVFSIQLYVIKPVSDLRWVSDFLRVLRFSPPISCQPRYN